MIKKLVYFFGESRYLRSRWLFFCITLTLIVFADFLVHRGHAEYLWEQIPGWAALYGFISCILIIVVSKFLGHQCGLRKKEDYYD